MSTNISAVREPSPYDEGSPHSWIADVLATTDEQAALDKRAEANGRLAQHSYDVAAAVEARSEYGRYAERVLTEHVRPASRDPKEHRRAAQEVLGLVQGGLRDAELRSLLTGGGATVSATGGGAAAFVAPPIVARQWASYRSPYRTVADQLSSQPMSASGMNVYVPSVTTGTNVQSQTEGVAPSETDPVVTFTASPVTPLSGLVNVSQQTLDRSGPGVSGDAFIAGQLKEQLDAQVDTYAIKQMLSGSQSVTDNNSFTIAGTSGVGGFLKDLKSAKSLARNTPGTRINCTAAFAIGEFCDFVTSYADAQGRPIFSPALNTSGAALTNAGDQHGEGYTGYVIAGLGLFADDSIPNLGTTSQTQVIVCRPDTVLLYEGEPIIEVSGQYTAGSLLPAVTVRSYVACVPRWPSSVIAISGTAYNASTFA